jgi:hypothetical protein
MGSNKQHSGSGSKQSGSIERPQRAGTILPFKYYNSTVASGKTSHHTSPLKKQAFGGSEPKKSKYIKNCTTVVSPFLLAQKTIAQGQQQFVSKTNFNVSPVKQSKPQMRKSCSEARVKVRESSRNSSQMMTGCTASTFAAGTKLPALQRVEILAQWKLN